MIIPNSSGTWAPQRRAPPGSCDCHLHIYDPRFAASRPGSRLTRHASVADYRLLQDRLGTSHAVVVQPAAYGFDNSVTLDAIAQLGFDKARGIAVVHPDVTDAELERLGAGGIRGIRFTQFDPHTAATTRDMIEPLAKRIEPLGWHVQIHLRSDQIVDAAAMLQRLPGTVVFDHLGRLGGGVNDPAMTVIRSMLDRGRTWVKLSGAYMFGAPPVYAEALPIAQAYLNAAPERMVWGSDWPHPTEKEKPDDALLFDLLSDWAPDEKTRHRILVDNPAKLYGFD